MTAPPAEPRPAPPAKPAPVSVLPRKGPALTLITVGMAEHYDYLRRQPELIAALNPGVDFCMIMVDNDGRGEPLVVNDPRVEVIGGPAPDMSVPEDCRGSYHHAAALALALQRVTTRFVAVIDPDLFVVYRGWIGEALEHMGARGLAFFGTPWHVRWFRKWRGFPCSHLFIADLEKVDRAALDFTPALIEDRKIAAFWFNQALRTLWPRLYARTLIETRRDTGWKLAVAFKNDPARPNETLLPVSDLSQDFEKPPHLRTHWGRWIERRLPVAWRFLPVEGTFVDPAEVPDMSLPDLVALAPEAFVWRGAPFALHMRHHARDFGEEAVEGPVDGVLVARLLDRISAAPSWLVWSDPAHRVKRLATQTELS